MRLVHGGVQYREYLNEEQRSPPRGPQRGSRVGVETRGPQRGSRVGVEEGCSAGRMQLEFHHGLLRAMVCLGGRRPTPERTGIGSISMKLHHPVEEFAHGRRLLVEEKGSPGSSGAFPR